MQGDGARVTVEGQARGREGCRRWSSRRKGKERHVDDHVERHVNTLLLEALQVEKVRGSLHTFNSENNPNALMLIHIRGCVSIRN